MTDEERELSEKELKQIEYEQLCEDWRHRDSMLWQSLAVAITLTGIIFGVALREDISCMSRFILLGIALILNCVLILKISKDHYYQLGSNELLRQIGGDKISERYDWRIHKPSDNLLEQLKRENKIPAPILYKWLGNCSAFKCFFWVLICLILFILCISIYFIFLSLTQSPPSGGGTVSTDTPTPPRAFAFGDIIHSSATHAPPSGTHTKYFSTSLTRTPDLPSRMPSNSSGGGTAEAGR